MVRTKMFNFHIIRSVLITKYKNKTGQITAELDNKIDTGSDSNLIPFHMFRPIFPRTPTIETK